MLGFLAVVQAAQSVLHWESRGVWQVSWQQDSQEPRALWREEKVLRTRKLLLLMKKSGGKKNETNKGWRELSATEENVNSSAFELQSLSWVGSHTHASAVTYRILTEDRSLQIITAWLSQGKKQHLLRLGKEKLLEDPRPGSACQGLIYLFCINKWNSGRI